MKLCILPLTAAVMLLGTPTVEGAETTPAGEPVIERVEDFFEPLSEYGSWLNLREMGWCWRPSGVADDWRPYTVGHWVETDDGPYWTSDEPWAWACYHYGRWFLDLDHGWLWKPGIEWAPAWVTFRENEDVIGWAPLPPGVDYLPVVEEVYVEEVYVPATAFVFVDAYDFWRPWGFSFYYSYRDHHCRRHTHCSIYDCTRYTTRYDYHRRHHHGGDRDRHRHRDRDGDRRSNPAGDTVTAPDRSGSTTDDAVVRDRTRTSPRPAGSDLRHSDRRRAWDRALDLQRSPRRSVRPDTTSAGRGSGGDKFSPPTGSVEIRDQADKVENPSGRAAAIRKKAGQSDRRKAWDRALAVQSSKPSPRSASPVPRGSFQNRDREQRAVSRNSRPAPSPTPRTQLTSPPRVQPSARSGSFRSTASRSAQSMGRGDGGKYYQRAAAAPAPVERSSPRASSIARSRASERSAIHSDRSDDRPGRHLGHGKRGKGR